VPQAIAARFGVPGFNAVVWTVNGGPLPSDQLSKRHVTTTAMRAWCGHVNPTPAGDCVIARVAFSADEKLTAAVAEAMHEDGVVKRLAEVGTEAVGSSAGELDALTRQQLELHRAIVQKAKSLLGAQ